MDIRAEIRRILKEELASLENPLDKSTGAALSSVSKFKEKVDSLKKSSQEKKKALATDLNAKKKSIMVPQNPNPNIERTRRQYDSMKIKDVEEKIRQQKEDEEELENMEADVEQISTALDAISKGEQQTDAPTDDIIPDMLGA